MLLLSPRVAVALPDCRSSRTETQVLALDTHMNLIVKVDVSGPNKQTLLPEERT